MPTPEDDKPLFEGADRRAKNLQSEEKARIDAFYAEAVRARESAEDPEIADRVMALAEAGREVFYSEHDNTGAYKFRRFARELNRELAGVGRETTAAELSPDGRIHFSPELAGRKMLFIGMGELDRFNKEGGSHAAGDAALQETLRVAERIIRAKLGGKEGAAASYELSRYGGNEFMATFPDITDDELEEIRQEILEAQPRLLGPDGKTPVEGVEGAPLVAESVRMEDVLETLNLIQAELGPNEKMEYADDIGRETVEVLRRKADWHLEVAKFDMRANRVIEKIEDAEDDPAKLAAAATFFQSYMKKGFEGTPLAEFEDFKARVEDGTIHELMVDLGYEAAHRRFAEDREYGSLEESIIDQRARMHRIDPHGAEAATGVGKVGETHGKTVLRLKRRLAEEARDEADAATGPDAGLKRLDAEQLQLEADLEATRRDPNTGLLERGVHYENLERALAEGRETTVVFVDMGFLKYFDQQGGRDVGDRALQTAAVFMEKAIENAKVAGKAYRYGGDEFTLQIDGDAAAAAMVIEELKKLQESEDAVIPAGPNSKEEYAPSRLSFNFGMADDKEGSELLKAVAETGKYSESDLADPKRRGNIQAEIMTKAADAGVEYNKAVSRFNLLIEEWRKLADIADPQAQAKRTKQVMSLVTYSGKAIFSEDGGLQQLTQWVMDRSLGVGSKELEAKIADFVQSRIERAHEKSGGQKEVLDRMIGADTQIHFLTDMVGKLGAEGAAQSAEVVRLRSSLVAAHAERQKIIDLRNTLGAT